MAHQGLILTLVSHLPRANLACGKANQRSVGSHEVIIEGQQAQLLSLFNLKLCPKLCCKFLFNLKIQ